MNEAKFRRKRYNKNPTAEKRNNKNIFDTQNIIFEELSKTFTKETSTCD